MQIFYDADELVDVQLLDMPLNDVLTLMAKYMEKIDAYRTKIDIDSDKFKFTIIAEEIDNQNHSMPGQ